MEKEKLNNQSCSTKYASPRGWPQTDRTVHYTEEPIFHQKSIAPSLRPKTVGRKTIQQQVKTQSFKADTMIELSSVKEGLSEIQTVQSYLNYTTSPKSVRIKSANRYKSLNAVKPSKQQFNPTVTNSQTDLQCFDDLVLKQKLKYKNNDLISPQLPPLSPLSSCETGPNYTQTTPHRFNTINPHITTEERQSKNLTQNLTFSPNLSAYHHAKTQPLVMSPKNSGFSMEQVTPELAAQIVKHYILPMFDSDIKKGLTKKANIRKQAIQSPQKLIISQNQGETNQKVIKTHVDQKKQNTSTILHEFKLSESLYQQLNQVRGLVSNIQESLERKEVERGLLSNEVIQLKSKLIKKNKEFKLLRHQLSNEIRKNQVLEQCSDFKDAQAEQLVQVSLLSENLRKKFSVQLRYNAGKLEECENQIFNQKMREEIFQNQMSYMQDQFKLLHDSIYQIDKKTHEKLVSELLIKSTLITELKQLVNYQETTISVLTTERDTFREETKDLNQIKTQIGKEKDILSTTTKEKITRLEQIIKKLQAENQAFDLAVQKGDRDLKRLSDEREKLKLRVTKLAARKGNFNTGFKTCKNCTKEFNEKENFNWSCRVHQSDWGGEMWWCCGKRGKDQPGCKFSKHVVRDDEKDDDEDKRQQEEDRQKMLKNVRCVCCKEIGHSIDQCPRDPNFKTNIQVKDDLIRINKIKDFRKLHADTIVNTTHFIKKSVMVPLQVDDDGNETEPANKNNPFMRGIMNFDDYNYNYHNHFVLIEDPGSKERQRLTNERKQAAKANGILINNIPLTNKNLDKQSEKHEYIHDAISIEPSEYQVEKEVVDNTSLFETAQLNKQDELDAASISGSSSNSKKNENAVMQDFREPTPATPLISDEFNFKVFYKDDEIACVQQKQKKDVFQDILTSRAEAIRSSQSMSKFNIVEFAPKQIQTVDSPRAKKRSRRNLGEVQTGLQIQDQMLEQDEHDASNQDGHQKSIEITKTYSENSFIKGMEFDQLKLEINRIIDDKIRSRSPSPQGSYKSQPNAPTELQPHDNNTSKRKNKK